MDWSPYASVWWRWTAPFSGPVNVRHDRSDFHAIVAVHRGTDLASLERLASNVRESSREAPVAFMAEAGVTYAVSVDGSGGSMGSIVLELEGPVPPRAEASVSRSLVLAGEAIVLESRVSGTGPFAYQWLRDGAAVVGATESSLDLRSAQRFQRGSYVLRVSTPYGTWDSEPVLVDVKAAPAGASRLMNLSTRALGGTGEAALIPGFVLRGEGTRALLLRAVGPALADFGVEGVMADPRVFLKRRVGSEQLHISSNSDWSDDGRASEIAETAERLGAFSLGVGSKDAALLVELEAGNYTLVSDDAAGGGGIAMVEVYDASEESAVAAPKLVNLSNRGLVADGAGVMIPGFVVSSEGPKTLLLRAVGPGLAQHGVTGVLTDPRLTVYRTDPATGVQEAILWNDNWGENGDAADIAAVAEQVGAFELEPGSKDAAFVITLQPGVYTVHAAGADGRTGVALVELYLVD
jgi:hypothetical protein